MIFSLLAPKPCLKPFSFYLAASALPPLLSFPFITFSAFFSQNWTPLRHIDNVKTTVPKKRFCLLSDKWFYYIWPIQPPPPHTPPAFSVSQIFPLNVWRGRTWPNLWQVRSQQGWECHQNILNFYDNPVTISNYMLLYSFRGMFSLLTKLIAIDSMISKIFLALSPLCWWLLKLEAANVN